MSDDSKTPNTLISGGADQEKMQEGFRDLHGFLSAKDPEDEEEDPNLYDLIRGGRRQSYLRLCIIRMDGSYFSIHHDDIHTLEGTADGKTLSLCIRGGLVVTLTGEHLTVLADYLGERKVKKIYAFNPKTCRIDEEKDRKKIPVIHGIFEDMQDLS